MKVRNDFVSNSSSCSFIVSLHSKADVAEFKKLIDTLKHKHVSLTVFYSLEYVHSWEGETFDEDDRSHLKPGNYVLVDTGDDHCDPNVFLKRFYDVERMFTAGYKFKLYKDPDAHVSAGMNLPRAR